MEKLLSYIRPAAPASGGKSLDLVVCSPSGERYMRRRTFIVLSVMAISHINGRVANSRGFVFIGNRLPRKHAISVP